MKVITFGEILLRLSAPGYNKLFQKDFLDTSFCGAEANVAVALSNYEVNASFVTKLPNNDVAKASINTLKYFGVDVSKIVYGNGRVGLYYLEKGASQRPSKIIYDRAYSAIALAKREDFNWNSIFEGVDWFHWSGINPALSDDLKDISLEACKVAKEKGLTVSCDLNFRSSLWTQEEAKKTMTKILPYVDVCIGNEEDADKMLGIRATGTDVDKGIINSESYISVARQINKNFGCKFVATTLRESISASRNKWSGLLYDSEEDKCYHSKIYDIQIVDRVGGGDSFSSGLIYGLIMNKSKQETVEFATAASCLKQTMEGDFNRSTVADVEKLVHGSGSGRVQR